ncbi:MAG TPA: hypothetical protein VLB50_11950 [Ignavibacteriaceae bacterium]|nr:hypothetical protein [Ignavibacteriaceae bacterium]
MKNSLLLSALIMICLLLFSPDSKAQISVQIGPGLGYSIPMGDYGGSTTDFYAGTKYGMKSGFNVHAKARVSFIFLSAFGEIGYTSFSGSGNAEETRGSLDLSQKVFSIKVGPEYQISIPMAPVTPYLQGFVSYNAISGSVDIQGVTNVPSGKYDLASASRIGLGAGVGAIINVMVFKLDVNIQYHAMNIAGKEYKLETVTSHSRLDNYTSLNDAKDPSYVAGSDDHFIGNDRSIGALELKLTVMFGL